MIRFHLFLNFFFCFFRDLRTKGIKVSSAHTDVHDGTVSDSGDDEDFILSTRDETKRKVSPPPGMMGTVIRKDRLLVQKRSESSRALTPTSALAESLSLLTTDTTGIVIVICRVH
jgi:hypothetical protein